MILISLDSVAPNQTLAGLSHYLAPNCRQKAIKIHTKKHIVLVAHLRARADGNELSL